MPKRDKGRQVKQTPRPAVQAAMPPEETEPAAQAVTVRYQLRHNLTNGELVNITGVTANSALDRRATRVVQRVLETCPGVRMRARRRSLEVYAPSPVHPQIAQALSPWTC